MKEIVKVLLAEGIDEDTIHEVLDVIEENYEVVDEAEGIMQLMKKHGGNKRNAVNDWVDQHNNEYVKATNDYNNATRTYVKSDGEKAKKEYEGAKRNLEAKLHTQDTANWRTKSTKNKMVLPSTKIIGHPEEDGYSIVTNGFEQGGKTLKGPHRKYLEKKEVKETKNK